MKQYMCVPGPKAIEVSKGQADSAFKDFQDLINRSAGAGWTYHSMETLTVQEKAGCLSTLMGHGPAAVNYYMLIFERDV